MSSSLATVRDQRESKPVDQPLNGLIGTTPHRQPTVNQTVNDGATQWLLDILGEAIRAHMKQEAAAALVGINAGQFSRQLKGEGHLSLKRAAALPREVWLDVAERIRATFGKGDPAAERKQLEEEAVRAVLRLVQAK